MTRQIHVISREIIKPAASPPHLRSYMLSSLDQRTPRYYAPFVLFYPHYDIYGRDKSSRLKSSLAQTLAQYYPFAGRFVGGASINCNDEGVEFVEARIKCTLSQILEISEPEALHQVFPAGGVRGDPDPEKGSGGLVIVQLNYFDCGGIAMAVCMSHKLGDGCTLSNFLTYWAAVTRGSGEQVSPHFISWPSNDSVPVPELAITERKNCVTRRFVFHNSKIAQLKATVTPTPTRVQVVSALIYKCATAAAGANLNLGSFRPSVLFLIVNMRRKMVPPLPPTTFGNLYGRITILTKSERERERELSAVTDQMKNKMIENLDGNEWRSTTREYLGNNFDIYTCSSLCGFPFYQLDFGWGKPIKATVGDLCSNMNMFVLMDTPNGDGIEALVCLDKQHMAIFERNKDLLEFTSSSLNASDSKAQ